MFKFTSPFLRSIVIGFILTANLNTFAFNSADCSRQFEIPYPFILEDKGMFRSASNKEWNVGGAGDVIITDYILLERKDFKIRTKQDLDAVYFVDDDTGWTVGTDGFIARSDDGGQKWKKQKSPTDQDLNSIYCVDKDHCWIAGSKGTVIRTLNGGKTWESMRSNTSIGLTAIRFVDRSVGFMSGSDDIIFKTTDGGVTWEPQKIPFESDGSGTIDYLWNLGVRDEQTYCTAGLSTAACTENGGKDWRIHYFYKDNDERALGFIGISVTPDSFYFVTRCNPDNDVITNDNLKTWKYMK